MLIKSFMNRSLKTRMMLLYTLLAVVLVGGISYYAYTFTVGLLKEKEMSILSDSLAYLEADVSSRMKTMNSEFLNIFDDTKFMDLYVKHITDAREINERAALNNEFQNYFLDIKMRNSDLVEAVYLFSDGEVFSSEYRPRFEFSQFVESAYYDMCMGQKNRILYADPYPEEKYFCVARSFYYTVNEENSFYPGVGYLSEDNDDYSTLVFLLKKEYLQKAIHEESQKRQTNVLILDEEGNLIVQEGTIGEALAENGKRIMEEIRKHSMGSFEGEAVNRRVGINTRSIGILDWNIIYIYMI